MQTLRARPLLQSLTRANVGRNATSNLRSYQLHHLPLRGSSQALARSTRVRLFMASSDLLADRTSQADGRCQSQSPNNRRDQSTPSIPLLPRTANLPTTTASSLLRTRLPLYPSILLAAQQRHNRNRRHHRHLLRCLRWQLVGQISHGQSTRPER